ncbi:acetyl-CoA C-acyltransferase [Polaribacter sp.]|uniref:acetyl-CoA C-acyltransferase n=1 Tax=Polaribacter sp. TaxID=1920175 RepID=UPI003F6C38A6
MNKVYIYDGIRSPFGKYGGELSTTRPDDLMAYILKKLVERNNNIKDLIEDVVIGDSNQAGEDSRNIARNSALLSGISINSGGITVNRLCGSGLAAVHLATNSLKCNEGELYIAGGVENMTRAPLIISKTEKAFTRNIDVADSTIGWRFPNKNLLDRFGTHTMPETSDNIGKKLKITRDESDLFAYQSQMKYKNALETGFFDDEILPFKILARNKRENEFIMTADQHPRLNTSLEGLSKLKPINKNGVATAGNSSGINDGAAAILLGTATMSSLLEKEPIVEIVAHAVSGVEPMYMGLGPVKASEKVLKRAGLTINDMDIIEINEAFSTQVLGCLKSLNLSFSDSRINPNGGAIAIGHPLGASGARLLITASRELKRIGGKYALVSLCIGIGQGIATIIKNPNIN